MLFPQNPPGCDPYENGLRTILDAAGGARKKRATSDTGPIYVLRDVSVLCNSTESLENATQTCGIINNQTGPFGACYNNSKREQMYQQCIFDVCQANMKCETLEGYSKQCGRSAAFGDWRAATGCKLFCAKNQEYKLGVKTQCIRTCNNKDPCPVEVGQEHTLIYKEPFDDGCVCKDGLIWDTVSASCIVEEMCNKTEPSFPKGFGVGAVCFHRESMFLLGEARFNSKCRDMCECSDDEKWKCTKLRGNHCAMKACRKVVKCLKKNVLFPEKCEEQFEDHQLVFHTDEQITTPKPKGRKGKGK